jgi:hypothetical protein
MHRASRASTTNHDQTHNHRKRLLTKPKPLHDEIFWYDLFEISE